MMAMFKLVIPKNRLYRIRNSSEMETPLSYFIFCTIFKLFRCHIVNLLQAPLLKLSKTQLGIFHIVTFVFARDLKYNG